MDLVEELEASSRLVLVDEDELDELVLALGFDDVFVLLGVNFTASPDLPDPLVEVGELDDEPPEADCVEDELVVPETRVEGDELEDAPRGVGLEEEALPLLGPLVDGDEPEDEVLDAGREEDEVDLPEPLVEVDEFEDELRGLGCAEEVLEGDEERELLDEGVLAELLSAVCVTGVLVSPEVSETF